MVNSMKKVSILSFVFIIVNLVTISFTFAVPALQLYMPDGVYYETNPWFPDSEDSWITTSNPFELWVVGASKHGNISKIDSVKLHISLLEDEYLLYQGLTTPIITIEENDPNIVFNKVELLISDFSTLPGQPGEIKSPHGIYPTYYASVDLFDLLVGTAEEAIYDYDKNFDPAHPEVSGNDLGDIQYYNVSYDGVFNFIHFDVTGTAYWKNGDERDVVAPYSHDADAVVPEPATMLLLGSGLLGLAGIGFRKRKRIAYSG